MYNSRHHWQTHIAVKGLDRRPFTLILDSILAYTTENMWMNLSPYPNLCKAEKIKSTPRILQKEFYSVWLINYDTNSRKSQSVHWGINHPFKLPPPPSCQAPPLSQKTVQVPLFRQSPVLYIGSSWVPPSKSWIFQWTLKILKVFHP